MLFCWKEETPIVRALTQTLERPAGSAAPNLPSASLRCIPAPLLRISQRRCSDWNYILRLHSAGFEGITVKNRAVTSRGGRKL